MQAYSNPKRENKPYALPDVEVWEDYIAIIKCRCGEYEVGAEMARCEAVCPSCERDARSTRVTKRTGWFYWFCFPGCMPDSEPFGPFETEEEAINEMREMAGYEDDGEDE